MISIVIPVYKSASTLVELHRRLSDISAAENWKCEVIYVNDASPDYSLNVLETLTHSIDFQIINLKNNVGQSSALLVGMLFAKHDLIATMDADLQDEPEKLPELVRSLKQSTDVIFAKRKGSYESGGRLFTSFLFKGLVHVFSGQRIPMNAGLFMVIRKKAALLLLPFLPQSPYLIGLIANAKLTCDSIVIDRRENQFGESSYTFKKRLVVAKRFFGTLKLRPTISLSEVTEWVNLNLLA
ncbi:glycosyltransferase [Dyadobacter pollutisoli]|uniref:Glycosyltransferase n=1 Tax=Dyadobacter pollutisoli TaxID=2910158 RepID=A0A9E8SL73_9BACT|nr:glycosyltransferase [Dyadobacter pollutisoli]WAC12723.1 glycosyltransferase [Dyadobacter pollutisoli]